MTDKNLCDSCTNIGCEFQSGIVRTKCAFYMPPQLEPDKCGNYVVQDSTTKNDIRDNRVKNELNRVKDELEPTTKNDLGADREDAVERLNALKQFIGYDKDSEIVKATQKSLDMAIKALEQEPILEKDGTLIVTTEHYKNVGRVLVQYGTNGTLFYQDQEPFMNKACVSSKVCEHDKEVVLGKIRTEILEYIDDLDIAKEICDIFDKYKAESEKT